jgi:hypothetical protein
LNGRVMALLPMWSLALIILGRSFRAFSLRVEDRATGRSAPLGQPADRGRRETPPVTRLRKRCKRTQRCARFADFEDGSPGSDPSKPRDVTTNCANEPRSAGWQRGHDDAEAMARSEPTAYSPGGVPGNPRMENVTNVHALRHTRSHKEGCLCAWCHTGADPSAENRYWSADRHAVFSGRSGARKVAVRRREAPIWRAVRPDLAAPAAENRPLAAVGSRSDRPAAGSGRFAARGGGYECSCRRGKTRLS